MFDLNSSPIANAMKNSFGISVGPQNLVAHMAIENSQFFLYCWNIWPLQNLIDLLTLIHLQIQIAQMTVLENIHSIFSHTMVVLNLRLVELTFLREDIFRNWEGLAFVGFVLQRYGVEQDAWPWCPMLWLWHSCTALIWATWFFLRWLTFYVVGLDPLFISMYWK